MKATGSVLVLATVLATGCGGAETRPPSQAVATPTAFHAVTGATAISVPTTLVPPSIRLPEGVTASQEHGQTVITLGDSVLPFPIDSSEPADIDAARALVTEVAKVLLARPGLRVEVVGFSSSDGPSPEYDTSLSAARSRFVCQIIRDAGVGIDDQSCWGGGRIDLEPAGPGPEDRRVEVRLVGA